jgi:hypothetical protein
VPERLPHVIPRTATMEPLNTHSSVATEGCAARRWVGTGEGAAAAIVLVDFTRNLLCYAGGGNAAERVGARSSSWGMEKKRGIVEEGGGGGVEALGSWRVNVNVSYAGHA